MSGAWISLHKVAASVMGVLFLTVTGCVSGNAHSPRIGDTGSTSSNGSSPTTGSAGAISSRTLVDTHWGAGAPDWGFSSVQGGIRIGPSLFADPAHHVLYVTDPAHGKLRAYDDQTGTERVSDEAPITGNSLEGAASPASGDAYVFDWTGVLQRIAGGQSVGSLKIAFVGPIGVWQVPGPLAVTRDETVWLHSLDGWHAIARNGTTLAAGTVSGTPPAPAARLAGKTLLIGSGSAERRVGVPDSALPVATSSPLPDDVIIDWAARSAETGVVWVVIADRSRRPAPHLTLIDVTPAGDVRSLQLPSPPDAAPAPYALTSAGFAALNGNTPQVTLFWAN